MGLFFGIRKLFSSGRGSILALSAAGHATEPACTPRCKCGSRPGSVARALGVQSREIWQATTGSLSAELYESRARQWKTHVSAFLLCFCTPLLYCSLFSLLYARFKLSPLLQRWTHCLCVCGHIACACVCCVCVLLACAGHRCMCVCWHLEELLLVRCFFVGIHWHINGSTVYHIHVYTSAVLTFLSTDVSQRGIPPV